jgi:hypothetical protein
MKNLEYSVVILPESKYYVKIDNKNKQMIVYIDKSDKEKIEDVFVFLKDLILGKFKFN